MNTGRKIGRKSRSRHQDRHIEPQPADRPASREVEAATALCLHDARRRIEEHRDQAKRERDRERELVRNAHPLQRVRELLDLGHRQEHDPDAQEGRQLQCGAGGEVEPRSTDPHRAPGDQRLAVGVEQAPQHERHREHHRQQKPEPPQVAGRPRGRGHERDGERQRRDRGETITQEDRREQRQHRHQLRRRMEALKPSGPLDVETQGHVVHPPSSAWPRMPSRLHGSTPRRRATWLPGGATKLACSGAVGEARKSLSEP